MPELSDTEISNKKLAAGLLGIFLGSFGVHKFVLGYNKAGIIMLVVSLAGGVITCGVATAVMSIIDLIEAERKKLKRKAKAERKKKRKKRKKKRNVNAKHRRFRETGR